MSVAYGPGVGTSRSGALVDGTPLDTNPFVIQAVPGQTGNQMEVRDPGGAVVAGFDISGNPIGGGASPSGAVILAPAGVNRNLIQPTADTNAGLEIVQHSATQSAPTFAVGPVPLVPALNWITAGNDTH